MSSAPLSSFHSSSDCTTVHISRRNRDTDDLDSNLYSATSTRPKASLVSKETGTTPLESDAFHSPMTRPPTGVSTSFTQSPTTARGVRCLGSLRPPGISILSSRSSSSSTASAEASSIGVTLPPQPQAGQIGPRSTDPVANNDGRQGSSNVLFVAAPPTQEAKPAPNAAAATAAGTPRLLPHHAMTPLATTTATTTAAAPAAANPPRRAVSSPMVPVTRGAGGGRMRRQSEEAAGTGTAGEARTLLHLPPLRPPSSYFTAGSKSGSSYHASPLSQAGGTTPHSTTLVSPPPKTLASVKVSDAEDDNGWWAAARRFAASKGNQVNAYLEKLVNPGAENYATANARTAASQARSRRASQVFQTLPRGVQDHPDSTSGGRHSRTASVSSGFDGAFDADRRTPPPRPPSSPRRNTHRSAFEPFSSIPRQDTGAGDDAMPLDVVVIDPAEEPLVWNDPTIQAPEVRVESRDAANEFFNVGDVSGSDAGGDDGEPNTYVVDLLSALRGYLTNPTEPFGHLVAAALASRSAEMPVRGFEIAAAEHNPFLVRMIVDSGTLEVQDEEAQRNVQDTVDELIPAAEGELSPGIYEYLSSFFKMPFVRLSHGQYALLKRSGFEYIKLMFDHQHVLPDQPFHSILINESRAMHVFNIVFMVVQLCSIVFCTVTVALVLAVWMKMDNNNLQSYGFYTLIVFGGGWALYLIFVIYAVRSRQDELRYEPQEQDSDRLLVPSPYVAVVPVLPLFDLFCVLNYVMAVRRKRIIVGHNIVASSRLSAAFHAVWFAFPQLITQSYFNNIQLSIEAQYRHRWAYTMLMVAVICQWGIALVGYVGFLFTHDSIDGFGFACFNMGRVPHLLERHSAAAHTLHYLTAFLLETNVYLLTANTINRPVSQPCDSYWNVILALSAFSVFYILIIFLTIALTDATAVRISFTSIALLAVQVTLCVCSERLQRKDCEVYRDYLFHGTFVFGYLSWGAYFLMFLVWLVMMVQWYILCHHQLNLFPRVLWPYARKDERFTKTKKVDEASTEKAASSQAVAGSKEEAQTT